MIQIVNRGAAVRITHLPTGLSVTSGDRQTLPGNQRSALKQLKALLSQQGRP